jgi:hypothetical protein
LTLPSRRSTLFLYYVNRNFTFLVKLAPLLRKGKGELGFGVIDHFLCIGTSICPI